MGETSDDDQGHNGRRLTPLEKAGRKRADQTNWRKKLQASRLKFDDLQKQRYLDHISKTGRKTEAARICGVCPQTALRHIENDPDFAAAVESAVADYAASIHKLALKLMNGVDEPIIGGKDKDEIVAHKRVYATNLLAMELRRTDPSYKERTEIDLNAGGGVLVAPAGVTPEDYLKQEAERTAAKAEPGADDAK